MATEEELASPDYHKAQVQALVAQLEPELRTHSSSEVLAWFAAREVLASANTYREYSHDGQQGYAEYLCELLLKLPSPVATAGLEQPPLDEMRTTVEKIFWHTTRYHQERFQMLQAGGSADVWDLLAERMKTFKLRVRNPGFVSHLNELLRSLFGAERVRTWCKSRLGFTIDDAIALNAAATRIGFEQYTARRERAKEGASQLRRYASATAKGREVPAEWAEAAARLASFGGKRQRRELKRLTTQWAALGFGDSMLFTVEALAEQAHVSQDVAAAYVRARTVGFGTTHVDFMFPTMTPVLAERPFVAFGERYMVPVHSWLDWGLRPFLESRLNPDTAEPGGGDARVWDWYQEHRATHVERTAVRLLTEATRATLSICAGKYTYESDGQTREGEIDGIVAWDSTILLIETKARALSASAIRGGPKRLRSHIEDVVRDAHEQGLRALAELGRGSSWEVRDEHGVSHHLVGAQYSNRFIVAVSLDPLEVVTPVLYELAAGSILQDQDLPWAVGLLELQPIAELVDGAGEVLSFLRRRQAINDDRRIVAMDELDYYGWYLTNGLRWDLPDSTQAPDWIMLESGTTEIEDWYYFCEGARTVPTARPKRYLPAKVQSIVRELERRGEAGWSEAVAIFCDMERSQLDLLAGELVSQADKATRQNRRFVTFHGYERPAAAGIMFYFDPHGTGKSARARLEANMREHIAQGKVRVCVGFLLELWKPDEAFAEWTMIQGDPA